jgi:hypothetical protein
VEGSPPEGERCTIVFTPALLPFVWLPMRSPPAAKTVFVAWDHSVDEHQAELPALIRGAGTHHTYIARCAGGDDPDGPISEDLCSDIHNSRCLHALLEALICLTAQTASANCRDAAGQLATREIATTG